MTATKIALIGLALVTLLIGASLYLLEEYNASAGERHEAVIQQANPTPTPTYLTPVPNHKLTVIPDPDDGSRAYAHWSLDEYAFTLHIVEVASDKGHAIAVTRAENKDSVIKNHATDDVASDPIGSFVSLFNVTEGHQSVVPDFGYLPIASKDPAKLEPDKLGYMYIINPYECSPPSNIQYIGHTGTGGMLNAVEWPFNIVETFDLVGTLLVGQEWYHLMRSQTLIERWVGDQRITYEIDFDCNIEDRDVCALIGGCITDPAQRASSQITGLKGGTHYRAVLYPNRGIGEQGGIAGPAVSELFTTRENDRRFDIAILAPSEARSGDTIQIEVRTDGAAAESFRWKWSDAGTFVGTEAKTTWIIPSYECTQDHLLTVAATSVSGHAIMADKKIRVEGFAPASDVCTADENGGGKTVE